MYIILLCRSIEVTSGPYMWITSAHVVASDKCTVNLGSNAHVHVPNKLTNFRSSSLIILSASFTSLILCLVLPFSPLFLAFSVAPSSLFLLLIPVVCHGRPYYNGLINLDT